MGAFPLTRLLDRSSAVFLILLAAFAVVIPTAQSAGAGKLRPPRVDLSRRAVRQIHLLRDAGALDRPDLGLCGILSLGHGAFFALGGYAMGMYLMRQIGTRGVYANPVLPDFMVFLNWQELPVFWYGFSHFAYAALMIFLAPGLLAFVFGWFAFRCRVTGVYLSIITQAMTYALMLGFFRNDFGFGGNNGLTDFKDILGFNVQARNDPRRAVRRFVPGACDLLPHLPRDRDVEIRQGAGGDPRRRERARAFSAIGSRTTSCSCSRCRPAWPALPARFTCRRSASSIPASLPPAIRSRR